MRRDHLPIGSALVLSMCHAGSSASRAPDAGATPTTVLTLTGAQIERGAIDALRVEALRRLAGNWVVVGTDYAGSRQAWSVYDGVVRIHDADRGGEWTEELSVRSPCELVRTRSAGSATIQTANTFVFADDGLYVGSATIPGGVRRANLLTVCARGHVYTYDMGTGQCDVWDPAMTAVSADPQVECRIVHNVGFDSFVLRPLGGGDSTSLGIQHDALLSTDPAANVARPAPSWAAAVLEADATR